MFTFTCSPYFGFLNGLAFIDISVDSESERYIVVECRYLQVLRLQALERYDEAVKALDSMISKDPTNSAAYKRKIAILKSQGKSVEAIKELSDYLNKYDKYIIITLV